MASPRAVGVWIFVSRANYPDGSQSLAIGLDVMLLMIDTHCHLTYDGLIERVDSVLAAAAAAGVDRMISVGTTPEDAQRACDLAQRKSQVYFAVGLHPHYAKEWSDHDVVAAAIRRLSQHEKCVAIGEMGLDRHYPEPPMEIQKSAFESQLGVILGLDMIEAAFDQIVDSHPQPPAPIRPPLRRSAKQKAIIIHNREATDETVGMIRNSRIPGDRFVFHCFTGSSEELDKILDLGAMVSFTGIVTFKNAADLAKCAARVPGDRIMIETDSPYLAPEPYRKVRPNEPRYVADVARFLAKIRGEEEIAFIAKVDANAVRFFGLT